MQSIDTEGTLTSWSSWEREYRNAGVFVEIDEANRMQRKMANHLGFQGDTDSQDCLTFVKDTLTREFHPSHESVYIVSKEFFDLFQNDKPSIVVSDRDATILIAKLNAIAIAARRKSKIKFFDQFRAEFALFMQEHFDKFYFVPDEVCKAIEIDPEGLIDRLHSIRESANSFEPTADNINPIVDDLLLLVHRHFSDLPDDFSLLFLKDSYIRSARDAIAAQMEWDQFDKTVHDVEMTEMLVDEFCDVWQVHLMIPHSWAFATTESYLREEGANILCEANASAVTPNFHYRMEEEIDSMVAALQEAVATKAITEEKAMESRKDQTKAIQVAYAEYSLSITELRASRSRKEVVQILNLKERNVLEYEKDRRQREREMQQRMEEYRKSLGLGSQVGAAF
jgi:hypothetical protein